MNVHVIYTRNCCIGGVRGVENTLVIDCARSPWSDKLLIVMVEGEGEKEREREGRRGRGRGKIEERKEEEERERKGKRRGRVWRNRENVWN
jgi:hypothetical protein